MNQPVKLITASVEVMGVNRLTGSVRLDIVERYEGNLERRHSVKVSTKDVVTLNVNKEGENASQG